LSTVSHHQDAGAVIFDHDRHGAGRREFWVFMYPKGYIYFAMAFSVAVELLNIKLRKRLAEPIKLRKDIEK